LGGDGADEMFGGYYRYQVLRYARFADVLPYGLRRGFHALLKRALSSGKGERTPSGKMLRMAKAVAATPERRYLDIIGRFDEDQKHSIYGEALTAFSPVDTVVQMRSLFEAATTHDVDEVAMEADLNSYLPGDILFKTDIASMANSLELRAPFLDHRIAEFAAGLPLSFKRTAFRRKRILVEAFKDLLPAVTLQRRKLGFGVPVGRWLKEEWREIAREALLEGKGVEQGLLRRAGLERMLGAHQGGQADHSYALWAILMFELWLEVGKK